MNGWGHLVLRAGLGIVFAARGGSQLVPLLGESPTSAAVYYESLGLAPGYLLAFAFGLIEALAGLALLVGARVSLAAILLIADVLFFAWTVHLPHGFFLNWSLEPGAGHGIEFHVIVLAGLVALLLDGPGRLSFDGRRARDAEEAELGRARLRQGH